MATRSGAPLVPLIKPRTQGLRGKFPSDKQSPLILDCKIKSSDSSRNSKKQRKQQRKPKTGWRSRSSPHSHQARGGTPTHQKTGNHRQSRPRPGPYPKPTLFQRLVRPSSPGPSPPKLPPPLRNQLPSGPPRESILPSTFAYPPLSPQIPQPAAPVAAYQAPVKPQWLTQMLAWVRLKPKDVPTGSGGAVLPPDEHEGRGRPHWEVSRLIATRERRPTTLLKLQNAALVIDNALREERASHPPKGNKSGASTTTPNRGRVPANRPPDQGASPAIPTSAQICGMCTGWKATPKEEGVKKEAAKVGEESGPERHILIPPPTHRQTLRLPLIDLPHPRTVTMLDGSSPQAGKIWKKANLTFSFDGKKMTETFLICNTGSHAAILGLKWLDAHNPEINWNQRTLSFPHAPPEHVAIAKEEEADKNPLKDMTDAESATLKDWLRDELKAGKIRPSKSSISSPVMFVPKKDGSRRLVVDYRRLNNRTKKNVYPSKVGYNNVRVKEGDEWKTAFRTKYGLYESLVMTFGLTNAPAAFQHFMNELFKDLLDVCVIIYLDDILIYSKDDASHTQHVHEVLKRLMENQLFCKASKWFSLDKLKIQAVQEWPVPTKVKEVQSFLGFANFLRCFVANFSHLARPLHNLVKKDVPWKWEEREQEAFQNLKDAITNAPVLCHADPAKPYFLETNASGAALGSILSQRQEDGRLHPLGFLSESFKGAEQNYDTHNKELLAIIRSFEYWRIFLEGTLHPITVFTDHQNLEYWKESRTFNRRHARWHLLLAGYNFQIVYRPGKQSGKPDALSR
ncbi:hypothetical protein RHS01_02083 [Rhizoctonia solani]|uniref:Reverse transcriptase n=1 Tax=Rhizoctonia solani TaxID=456999 RepID=A0A8H7IJU2_9AGAM|nr:hypothetical protein RHS01_02083 [Rhizoctonia solani]